MKYNKEKYNNVVLSVFLVSFAVLLTIFSVAFGDNLFFIFVAVVFLIIALHPKKYEIRNQTLSFYRFFLHNEVNIKEIPALLITTYDRRTRYGMHIIKSTDKNGNTSNAAYVYILKKLDMNELNKYASACSVKKLCDSDDIIFGMQYNERAFIDLLKSGFNGKIYIWRYFYDRIEKDLITGNGVEEDRIIIL
ncbi:MAG: hypothetical protein LBQ27_00135 [Clostridiales bacterium]|jgi:hypothetical protein|nr:hypothetical protein [Clostridiales bacterium]